MMVTVLIGTDLEGWLKWIFVKEEVLFVFGRLFLRIYFCGPEKGRFHRHIGPTGLAAEPVQGAALTLQRVDDVHGRHGLALCVLRVGDGISDDVFEEHFEDTSSFFVDETGNTLDASTTRQATNGGLRDALDVVAQHLPVAFGTSLAQSFASFSSARHVSFVQLSVK
jgi:hypothetical protein